MEKNCKVTIIEPVATRIQSEQSFVSEKLRVAAYARVSTEQDEQQNSYEAQMDYYRCPAGNPPTSRY